MPRETKVQAVIEDVDSARWSEYHTICDPCRNGTVRDCPFMRYDDIEAAIKELGAHAVRTILSGSCKYTYKVVKCPGFRRGPLPPLDEQILLQIVRTRGRVLPD